MIYTAMIAEWHDPETKAAVAKIKRPPARFIGGKHGARVALAQALEACGGGFDLALDPFGGSGMVSRAIADSGMADTVVYGDFDGYCRRIAYMNSSAAAAHHEDVLMAMGGVGRDQRIPDHIVTWLAEYFQDATQAELDVWLPYLSFAGKDSAVRDIASVGRYNRVPAKWPDASGWLDGLQVVTDTTAADLLAAYTPFSLRTLVVLDPPYPGAHGASYRDSTWSIADYEAMINNLLLNGVDTILAFGDNRSGVESMMSVIPGNKVKCIKFNIRTNGTAMGSRDAAYVIRGRCAA